MTGTKQVGLPSPYSLASAHSVQPLLMRKRALGLPISAICKALSFLFPPSMSLQGERAIQHRRSKKQTSAQIHYDKMTNTRNEPDMVTACAHLSAGAGIHVDRLLRGFRHYHYFLYRNRMRTTAFKHLAFGPHIVPSVRDQFLPNITVRKLA